MAKGVYIGADKKLYGVVANLDCFDIGCDNSTRELITIAGNTITFNGNYPENFNGDPIYHPIELVAKYDVVLKFEVVHFQNAFSLSFYSNGGALIPNDSQLGGYYGYTCFLRKGESCSYYMCGDFPYDGPVAIQARITAFSLVPVKLLEVVEESNKRFVPWPDYDPGWLTVPEDDAGDNIFITLKALKDNTILAIQGNNVIVTKGNEIPVPIYGGSVSSEFRLNKDDTIKIERYMGYEEYFTINGTFSIEENSTRKVTKAYIGIDGKARKVTKAYIGIDGKARKIF